MHNGREEVITHLQIISTWASFALGHDLQFFTEKHLENIVSWTDDALSMLKEDDTLICMQYDSLSKSADTLAHLFSLINEQQQIVRCKDCKKRKTEECLMYWNGILDDETWNDDWYCADGVKKDD